MAAHQDRSSAQCCDPEGRLSDDDSDDDSYDHGQVTQSASLLCSSASHNTTEFYWHGSSPDYYSDPFQPTTDLDHNSGSTCLLKNRSTLSIKVIVIGDPGVGKTSMIQRYINKKYTNVYKWTIGGSVNLNILLTENVEEVVIWSNDSDHGRKISFLIDFALKLIRWSDTTDIKLQLWDIAGQERFTSMTRVYYRNSDGCIIMFDLSQRSSFLNALKWKKDLDEKCRLPDGTPLPCLLLANKCDLSSREVSQIEIEAFCREQDFIGWTEISVKLGLMIDESFRFLIEHMVSRHRNSSSSEPEDKPAVNLVAEASYFDSGGCVCW